MPEHVRRWRRASRSGVAAVLAVLLAGSLAVAAPTPAQAHPHWGDLLDKGKAGRHCIPPSNIHEHVLDTGSTDWLWGYEWVWAQERFVKSEGRFVTNNTDAPQTVTFSSQASQTHTVSTAHTATTQAQATFKIGLTITATFSLSKTTTDSTTTQIGVNTTIVVPPHTRVQADYGVFVYDVAFWFHVFFRRNSQNPPQPCVRQGLSGHHLLTAPTTDQGWQVHFVPLSTQASFS